MPVSNASVNVTGWQVVEAARVDEFVPGDMIGGDGGGGPYARVLESGPAKPDSGYEWRIKYQNFSNNGMTIWEGRRHSRDKRWIKPFEIEEDPS